MIEAIAVIVWSIIGFLALRKFNIYRLGIVGFIVIVLIAGPIAWIVTLTALCNQLIDS